MAAVVGLNVLLIVAAELTGDLFHATAMIHGFALLFIFLAGARIFRRYHVYDPELRTYLRYGLAAMAVFAASHLIELFSIVVLKNYADATYATVIDLYGVSLLLLMAGSASLNRSIRKSSAAPVVAAWACIALLLALAAGFLTGRVPVSLELDVAVPYAYAVGLTALAAAASLLARRIGNRYLAYAPFFNHMIVATLLVAAAALQYVFYEGLETLGAPEYQVIYLSHFFFYAALSAMYLAFGASLAPRGVFEDVRVFLEKEASPLEKKGEK